MTYSNETIGARAAFRHRNERASLLGRLARYRMFRRTRRELDGLSSRELADLGISRSMITEIAREAAYGAR